jgi:hypothetical protein
MTSNSSTERFTTGPVLVDLLNLANPDALPAPLTVSKRNSDNPLENKFLLSVLNNGQDRLVLGGPNPAGLYVNFSDLMDVKSMEKISVSMEGTAVHASVVYPMLSLQINGRDIATPDNPNLDPTLPPSPNNQHLGLWQADEPVLYIWPQKEIEILPQENLLIQFENVSSDFRPAIRYLQISWEMVVRPYDPDRARDTPLEGFSQVSVQLQRPADYVEPPLPIQAYWLNDQNRIYTTQESDETIINELHFALSNVGLHPFSLDCSKHSRGVPYFELVMVGKTPTDMGSFSSAVADISDLALAELTDTTPRKDLNQLWRVNKRIQGPIVKWEIRPDLDFDWKKEGNKVSQSKKILLGTELDATLTFKLHELRSRLEDGVALVYLKYYNMPDHDDGQLVLFMEKRRLEDGVSLTPQLVKGKTPIAHPFYWKSELVNTPEKNYRNSIHLNGWVGIGTSAPEESLHIQNGNLRVDGKLVADQLELKNSRRIKANHLDGGSNQFVKFGALDRSEDPNEDFGRVTFVQGVRILRLQAVYKSDDYEETVDPVVQIKDCDLVITDGKNILPEKGQTSYIGKRNNAFDRVYVRESHVNSSFELSDRTLKTNILPLAEQLNATELIRRIQPVAYQMKDEEPSGRMHFGFIADEVEKYLPNAVSQEAKDGPRSLEYRAVNTLLFQAVKDQERTIDSLQKKVETMEHHFLELKKEIDLLKKVFPTA